MIISLFPHMDIVSREKRSQMMAGIKSKNTRPEKTIRSLLHGLGFRFRVQRKDLPGKPDIVLPKYKTVIFIHGCFWHQHSGCKYAYMPKSNAEFWAKKLDGNVIRDSGIQKKLAAMGWRIIVIWECEVKLMVGHPERMREMIIS